MTDKDLQFFQEIAEKILIYCANAQIDNTKQVFHFAEKRSEFHLLCPAVPKGATVAPSRTVAEVSQPNQMQKGVLKFTKKEICTMPPKYQNLFAHNSYIVTYRFHKGVYEARFRRDGFNISASSKDLCVMKHKFIEEFNRQAQEKEKAIAEENAPTPIFFNDCLKNWLAIKERTVKESTYKRYLQICNCHIFNHFEGRAVTEITRQELQDYVFSYWDRGTPRTAEEILLIVRCVLEIASEDYGFVSPAKKIVLPFREAKKGSALTKAEERLLVERCTDNQLAASSALLVLLYFGLRRSELKTLTVNENSITVVTSKTRMGRNEVLRTIPFTPVFRRVMHHVDFESAKNTNLNTLCSTLKRILPSHHLHELRYTFITRCKECHVYPEVVMLWDGHEEDKDVRSSKVDRGYTTFSPEFLLSEAEKVDYPL